jgi:hypothetical protein
MHRLGFSAARRITGRKLAAANRLADFQLRSELAVLHGVRQRMASAPGAITLWRKAIAPLTVSAQGSTRPAPLARIQPKQDGGALR